jgi:hypothetical protein
LFFKRSRYAFPLEWQSLDALSTLAGCGNSPPAIKRRADRSEKSPSNRAVSLKSINRSSGVEAIARVL